MASFGNQNPTPIRPPGQASCFQVVETPHSYRFSLEVPKAVIDFAQSCYRGARNIKAVFAASTQKQIEQESYKAVVALQINEDRKERERQGRILASALRREQRNTTGLSRHDALSHIAGAFRMPIKQTEMFIKLHNRGRDKRIDESREILARRLHNEGKSLSEIGTRLSVSKSTAHRVMENVKGTGNDE